LVVAVVTVSDLSANQCVFVPTPRPQKHLKSCNLTTITLFLVLIKKYIQYLRASKLYIYITKN